MDGRRVKEKVKSIDLAPQDDDINKSEIVKCYYDVNTK